MECKTLIVMTKSSKYHGNCVTGIDTETGKWIRLMTHDEQSQGAVSDVLLKYADGTELDVLDIVTAPIKEWCGDNLHPENYYLDETHFFEKTGNATFADVLALHPDEKHRFIYNNSLPFVDLEHINYVDYSLCLVKVDDLTIYQTDNSLGKKKWKASFTYNDAKYKGIAMTDPKFYHLVSGTSYKTAYVVISIGTPWDGRYFKYLSAIFVQKNSMILPDQNDVETETVDLMTINVDAQPGNGIAVFRDYDTFKKELTKQLSVFKTEKYSSESLKDALADRDQLKKIKNKLTEKRKEIDRIANQPYELVKEQLDELIDLVKEPYKLVDAYIKEQEKRVKKDEIYVYARNKASVLADLSEDFVSSKSFFDPRWLNASYSMRRCYNDIDTLVENAQVNLKKIECLPDEMIAVAMTRYFETLSYDSVDAFVKNLKVAQEKNAVKKTEPSAMPVLKKEEPHQPVIEEKNSVVFRVDGTKEQINNGYRLLKQAGLVVEVLSKSI